MVLRVLQAVSDLGHGREALFRRRIGSGAAPLAAAAGLLSQRLSASGAGLSREPAGLPAAAAEPDAAAVLAQQPPVRIFGTLFICSLGQGGLPATPLGLYKLLGC